MSLVYIGKVWQSKSFSLCFEVKERSLGKKAFLHFQLKSQKLFLSNQKPKDLQIQGQISNLLRKYVSGKILVSIQEESNKELWLFFCRRGEESTSYFLRLKLDGGTEVSLIEQEENRIIFRYGLKGTYTRVKTFEEDYPAIDEAKNLFQEYAEEYSASLTEDKDKVEKPAKVHEEKIKHAARDTKKTQT